ncbi:hypothetical protein HK101_009233 [Irineochytrium annulatum]|nr:hypothetical protein HK101_009233 [Irineochytrium annulatum]
MPPKKAKKSKKLDAEKLAAEEEERKKRADEEARLAEIRAKKERDLREQKEKEALELLFAQNKERLEEETEKALEIIQKHDGEISQAMEVAKSENNWTKFVDCNTLPDPNDEKELNTYLSLWEEEPLGADDETSLQSLLNILPNAEKLCDDIVHAMAIESDKQNEAGALHLRLQLLTLRSLIQAKWDLVTCQVLQHVDHFQIEANENFLYSTEIDRYAFGVWGNLTKNPRHKNIDFSNVNLSMTLPKPIALANVAVRMLYQTGLSASAPYILQEGSKNLSIVGGVLSFDLFEMPEPPKTFDKWIIRQSS